MQIEKAPLLSGRRTTLQVTRRGARYNLGHYNLILLDPGARRPNPDNGATRGGTKQRKHLLRVAEPTRPEPIEKRSELFIRRRRHDERVAVYDPVVTWTTLLVGPGSHPLRRHAQMRSREACSLLLPSSRAFRERCSAVTSLAIGNALIRGRGRHRVGEHLDRYHRGAVDQDGRPVEVFQLPPSIGSKPLERALDRANDLELGSAACPVRHGQQFPGSSGVVAAKRCGGVFDEMFEDDGSGAVPAEGTKNCVEALRLRRRDCWRSVRLLHVAARTAPSLSTCVLSTATRARSPSSSPFTRLRALSSRAGVRGFHRDSSIRSSSSSCAPPPLLNS